MPDPPREGNAAQRGKRFPESLPQGRRAVRWACAVCAWGAFLLLYGALAHRTSVLGIVGGLIFLAAGLRWLLYARQNRRPRDADAPETR